MRQALHRLLVGTPGRGLMDVTPKMCGWVSNEGIGTGLLTI